MTIIYFRRKSLDFYNSLSLQQNWGTTSNCRDGLRKETILMEHNSNQLISLGVNMKTLLKYLFMISISLIFISCSGASVSLVGGKKPEHPVKVIALSPSAGILGDAIAIELATYDINVIDPTQCSNLVARLNLNEIEIGMPQNLVKLKNEGIDGYLVVKVAAGYDGLPQSASARLNSTHNGQLIAGVSWQNGYGGQAGSIADRQMRSDVASAAKQIVKELIKNIIR